MAPVLAPESRMLGLSVSASRAERAGDKYGPVHTWANIRHSRLHNGPVAIGRIRQIAQ